MCLVSVSSVIWLYGKFGLLLLYNKLLPMESAKILQADYLDLIFDNRNKGYGGYELRKHYKARALRALGITCALLLLGIGVPALLGKSEEPLGLIPEQAREVQLQDIDLPRPPDAPKPPETPADAAPSIAKTIMNTVPVIVNEEVRPDLKPPRTEELIDAVSGPVTNPGNEGSEVAMSKEKPEGPAGSGNRPDEPAGGGGGGESTPISYAQEMPEFPGGRQALNNYLKRNLAYPVGAREDGIQGRVIVRFVVNTEGRIENATIVRGIGGGCDQEALRVVKAMPRWKPGKQNGHLVKVYYMLPVNFALQ